MMSYDVPMISYDFPMISYDFLQQTFQEYSSILQSQILWKQSMDRIISNHCEPNFQKNMPTAIRRSTTNTKMLLKKQGLKKWPANCWKVLRTTSANPNKFQDKSRLFANLWSIVGPCVCHLSTHNLVKNMGIRRRILSGY